MFRTVVLVFAAVHLAVSAPAADSHAKPNLSDRAMAIVKETNDFTTELVAIHGDYTVLSDLTEIPPQTIETMIGRVKQQKHALHSIKVQVNAYLGTLVSYQIQERAVMEFSRISLERYEKVLDKIAMNILGARSNIGKIPKERVSDELTTAVALESSKFDRLSTEIAEIDAELEKVRSDAQDGSGKEAQKVVLTKLNEVIQRSQAIRTEMSQAYLSDLETGVVDGLEMNMIQQAQVDTLLTVLVWFENYCRNYQELMRKILNVPSSL